MYYLRPARLRLHPDRFSKAGKTILGIVFRSFPKNDRDPSTWTVHSPPELNQWRPIPGLGGRLSGYWIGGLPVCQAGGPPLEFEKTGLSLCGLRGGVGGTRYSQGVT